MAAAGDVTMTKPQRSVSLPILGLAHSRAGTPLLHFDKVKAERCLGLPTQFLGLVKSVARVAQWIRETIGDVIQVAFQSEGQIGTEKKTIAQAGFSAKGSGKKRFQTARLVNYFSRFENGIDGKVELAALNMIFVDIAQAKFVLYFLPLGSIGITVQSAQPLKTGPKSMAEGVVVGIAQPANRIEGEELVIHEHRICAGKQTMDRTELQFDLMGLGFEAGTLGKRQGKKPQKAQRQEKQPFHRIYIFRY